MDVKDYIIAGSIDVESAIIIYSLMAFHIYILDMINALNPFTYGLYISILF